jgi:hypothetical protein
MLLALVGLCAAGAGICQSAGNVAQSTAQKDQGGATYRITAREVSVDVVAMRGRGELVLDLKPDELQVSEAFLGDSEDERAVKRSVAQPGLIKSLHIIDPNGRDDSEKDASGEDASGDGGVQIAASCLERSAMHYRLAFRPGPEGWRSGYHKVNVSTTRRGVRLYFRHRYFVGLTEAPAKAAATEKQAIEKLMTRAACYYPDQPPSVGLRARLVDKGRSDILSYSVAVDADSISFLMLAGDAGAAFNQRRTELDYGICTFDRNGKPLEFSHASAVKNLAPAEYARALERGVTHILEFAAPENLAITRVVVRDRATGNLGAVDLRNPYGRAAEPGAMPEPEDAEDAAIVTAHTEENLEKLQAWLRMDGLQRDWNFGGSGNRAPLVLPVPPGPIGSFGSIVPAAHALCGDVYELPRSTVLLPDFRELDPIGSIYAATLDVPDQVFENTSGIPGVTPRTNLFGIDYHGTLQIAQPGEYKFLMLSDDGATLRIDDKKVIDLDGLHMAEGRSGGMSLAAGSHAIEVQYYQGAVNAVALVLWVKPPGARDWAVMDLNDYASPSAETPLTRTAQ